MNIDRQEQHNTTEGARRLHRTGAIRSTDGEQGRSQRSHDSSHRSCCCVCLTSDKRSFVFYTAGLLGCFGLGVYLCFIESYFGGGILLITGFVFAFLLVTNLHCCTTAEVNVRSRFRPNTVSAAVDGYGTGSTPNTSALRYGWSQTVHEDPTHRFVRYSTCKLPTYEEVMVSQPPAYETVMENDSRNS